MSNTLDMVVTRRTTSGSGQQLPPTSRTSSTAAVPRSNKGKASRPSSLAQEVEASFANGDRNPTSNSPDFSGPQFSDDAVFSVRVHFLWVINIRLTRCEGWLPYKEIKSEREGQEEGTSHQLYDAHGANRIE